MKNDIWDKIGGVGGGGNSNNDDIFLRLEAGKDVKIRPLKDPLPIWVYYNKMTNGKTNRAVTSVELERPENCIIAKKHQLKPKLRFAVNVLDRGDVDSNGVAKMKILEGPLTIFKDMRIYQEATGNAPGGKNGADFFVKKVPPPDGNPINTTYSVSALGEAPISAEEHAMIKEKGGLFVLEDFFKIVPQDEIEDKLFSDDSNSSRTTAGAGSTLSGSEMSVDNDLF